MSSNIIGPFPKKSDAQSETVEKPSGYLDDIKEPVVTICQNDLDNKKDKENTKKYHSQGQSARSKGLFNLDHEWSEEKFCTCEPDSYTNLYKIKIEGQDMETCQIVVFPQAFVPSKKKKNDKKWRIN